MKHLTKINDISKNELIDILDLAKELELKKKQDGFLPPLAKGKTLAMLFEKPSLRTKAAFEIAMADLGGYPIFFGASDVFLASDKEERESIYDITKNVDHFADIICARVFRHESIQNFAKFSDVPVINALCDKHHPTQAICDIYAIREHFKDLENLKLAWVGDGNNVATSLVQICDLLDIYVSIATPAGYEIPKQEIQNIKNIEVTNDPKKAVKDADIVVTDTFVSMGQESEKKERYKIFSPYQVNENLMKNAKKKAIFMHCLPAHRGYEVTEGVIDGPQSIIFDEAVSRLYIARALILKLLKINF